MGEISPRIPREHNKYHGYTVRGTPHCPLNASFRKGKTCLNLYPPSIHGTFVYLPTWNPKQPFINGCFNWMIPNHYMKNGCLTKHPIKNCCLGFQVLIYQPFELYYGKYTMGILIMGNSRTSPNLRRCFLWNVITRDGDIIKHFRHLKWRYKNLKQYGYGLCKGIPTP